MDVGIPTIPKDCYQCGSTEFALAEEDPNCGWITCDRCGERVVSTADLAAWAAHNKEVAIREKLGVDEFLDARRVHNKGP